MTKRGNDERQRRGLHPLAAVLLSAVWPGLGHIGYRNRRAATLGTAAAVAAAAAVLYALTSDTGTRITWLLTRGRLQAVIVAVLCLLLFRWAVAYDAYRIAAGHRRQPHSSVLRRAGAMLALTALAMFIAAPHLFTVHLAATHSSVLSEVFDASDTQAAKPTPLPVPAASTAPGDTLDPADPASGPVQQPTPATALQAPLSSRSSCHDLTQPEAAVIHPDFDPPEAASSCAAAVPMPAIGPNATGKATDEPPDEEPSTPAQPDTMMDEEPEVPRTVQHSESVEATEEGAADRLTIALLGSDGGYRRTGVRTDTIIVLSINVTTGEAAAFSIPRNWQYVTFPEGTAASRQWPDGYPGIANKIYGLGRSYPGAFPDAEDKPGRAIKLALAQLTGLDVHYYIMVDMVGFVEAIDLFGGINIHVSESINDRIAPISADGPHIDIAVEPGEHHFDGLTALGYARARTQSSDYHRMTRQRCVVAALIDQVSPLVAVWEYMYGELSEIISDHISTDIPLDMFRRFATVAARLETSNIVTVNFIPSEGFPTGRAPIRQVREAVAQALEGTSSKANNALSDRCQERQRSS